MAKTYIEKTALDARATSSTLHPIGTTTPKFGKVKIKKVLHMNDTQPAQSEFGIANRI